LIKILEIEEPETEKVAEIDFLSHTDDI